MSTNSATARLAEVSPQVKARIAGVLYLITIIVGIFDEAVVKGNIIVSGNAAATAANLKSMEFLWRVGIAGEMVTFIVVVVLSLLIYDLLKPVSKGLALLATFFGLIAATVQAAYSVQLFEALFPLGRAEYLKVFTPDQLSAMAMLAIRTHDVGFALCLFFFSPFFLVAGFLIYKSTYFPRAIGVLYQISGVGYMFYGFVRILAPAIASVTFNAVAVPVFVGEVSFCLWLLFKGVRIARWNELAGI